MCGIWALFGIADGVLRRAAADCFLVAHRGPDVTRIQSIKKVPHSLLGAHRLQINDLTGGTQPMCIKQYPHLTLICNGEVYNAFALRDAYGFQFESRCDIEIILHLYERFGPEETVAKLDGIFAFAVVDTKRYQLHLGRDVFGVLPMFIFFSEGALGLCSEVKGLQLAAAESNKAEIFPFPPGHLMTYKLTIQGQAKLELKKKVIYIGGSDPLVENGITLSSSIHVNIRTLLKEAVKKRLMSEREIGCLLSGGLDSSLVTALVVECIRESSNDSIHKKSSVQTFCIGMEGSPDVEHARLVAQYLNTEHHEIFFTAEEGFHAISDVIYALETFDVITIRGAVGMYLMVKYIRENTRTAVLFSGEGSDELCQGYLYFHNAPTPEEADTDSRRLLQEIYLYDALRADRATAAHGLELRVPFLDKVFTSYYLSLPPEERQPREGVEKYLLRKSFGDTGILPDAILWRSKEGFSDGMASKKKSWFKYLQDMVEDKISDGMLCEASKRFQGIIPTSKEAYYYRQVFEEFFPGRHSLMPHYWMPKWCVASDPSARVLPHYK